MVLLFTSNEKSAASICSEVAEGDDEYSRGRHHEVDASTGGGHA
jgi:hypothetical protein